MRANAEANPKALLSRIWRWHTGWCPGWKAYQEHLKTTKPSWRRSGLPSRPARIGPCGRWR